MEVLSPNEWGARVDYDKWDDVFYLKDKVGVHWGGNEQPSWASGPDAEKMILRRWEDWHLDGKGWRGLAYGWGIGASGLIYRIRGWNNYGAHTGDEDGDSISNNKEVIPFVFIMGKNSGPPTDAMWESARWLYHELQKDNRGDKDFEVKGHKELKGTDTVCPGPFIMSGLQRISEPLPSELELRVIALEEAHVGRDLDKMAERIAREERRSAEIEQENQRQWRVIQDVADFVAAVRAL